MLQYIPFHTCAGVESQLGSVQQGDSPLQLQSPLPGVTLPQYQPDPSLPATQPASTDGSASQHVSGPSAGDGRAAADSNSPSAAAAVDLQPGASTSTAAEEPSKQASAVERHSPAPESVTADKDKPNGQKSSNKEALDRQEPAPLDSLCSTHLLTSTCR